MMVGFALFGLMRLKSYVPVPALWRWKRLAEQQGVAYAKTVAEAMNLKLERTIQRTGKIRAEQFSILSPGRKMGKQKGHD